MITPSFGLTATERVLPKLALDFTTALLDSRVTFTRTTGASNPATYVDSSGYVTVATNNQARFDYDPVTLACKGLLIEEARTNIFTYSAELDRLSKSRSTITADQANAPDNQNTADAFNDDATASNTHFASSPSFSFTSGTSYTLSVYAKQNGRNISLALSSGSFGANVRYTFNLTDGTYAQNVAGTNSSANIVDAGGGYWRCSVTSQATATASSVVLFYLINGSTLSYSGDITKGVYIWGAQLEAGAFATSYIPTTTTALTRNADVATMTGTNFSDWFNASEGTFQAKYILEGKNPGTPGYSQGVLCAWSGAYANSISIFEYINVSNESRTRGYIVAANTIVCNLQQTVLSAPNTPYDIVLGYKINSFVACKNAGTILTDSSGNVPTGINELRIGQEYSGPTRSLNGWIQQINYWPQRVVNAESQAFSKV